MAAPAGKVIVSPHKLTRLDQSDPGTGATILYDGQEWQVTEQASYSTDEGYRVHERCCEVGDTTAYLLKEGDPKQGIIRWFFTGKIDDRAAAVAEPSRGGGAASRPRPATPWRD